MRTCVLGQCLVHNRFVSQGHNNTSADKNTDWDEQLNKYTGFSAYFGFTIFFTRGQYFFHTVLQQFQKLFIGFICSFNIYFVPVLFKKVFFKGINSILCFVSAKFECCGVFSYPCTGLYGCEDWEVMFHVIINHFELSYPRRLWICCLYIPKQSILLEDIPWYSSISTMSLFSSLSQVSVIEITVYLLSSYLKQCLNLYKCMMDIDPSIITLPLNCSSITIFTMAVCVIIEIIFRCIQNISSPLFHIQLIGYGPSLSWVF